MAAGSAFGPHVMAASGAKIPQSRFEKADKLGARTEQNAPLVFLQAHKDSQRSVSIG